MIPEKIWVEEVGIALWHLKNCRERIHGNTYYVEANTHQSLYWGAMLNIRQIAFFPSVTNVGIFCCTITGYKVTCTKDSFKVMIRASRERQGYYCRHLYATRSH